MPTDEERWEAIEEATELLIDKSYQPALEHLKRVIEADPGNAYAFYYTGVAMDELGRREAARDAFQAAVTVAPSYLAARVGLAHALRKTGDLDGAVREAMEALAQFPEDGDAHFAIGLALAAAGDRKGARAHLEVFLRSGAEIEAQIEARAMLEQLASDGGPIEFDE
jgi:tetratricopeptide (TPR) repeat protein